MWSLPLITAQVGRGEAGVRSLQPASLVLCLATLSDMQCRRRWRNASNDQPTDAEWDTIEAWIDGAYRDLVTTGVVAMAIGGMFAYPNNVPPPGCLLCDGTQYARIDYPELYSALASAFIVDADNFVVPDMTNLFVKGTTDDTQLNTSGGVQQSFLQATDIPPHEHGLQMSGNVGTNVTRAVQGQNAIVGTGVTVTASYTQTAFSNEPPYIYLCWMIQATGGG